MKIKKGQFMAWSQGQYSDYCVESLAVALCDFDLSKEKSEWAKDNCYEAKSPWKQSSVELRIKDGGMSFLGWLNKKGLCEDVEYIEVHTGDYEEVDIKAWWRE